MALRLVAFVLASHAQGRGGGAAHARPSVHVAPGAPGLSPAAGSAIGVLVGRVGAGARMPKIGNALHAAPLQKHAAAAPSAAKSRANSLRINSKHADDLEKHFLDLSDQLHLATLDREKASLALKRANRMHKKAVQAKHRVAKPSSKKEAPRGKRMQRGMAKATERLRKSKERAKEARKRVEAATQEEKQARLKRDKAKSMVREAEQEKVHAWRSSLRPERGVAAVARGRGSPRGAARPGAAAKRSRKGPQPPDAAKASRGAGEEATPPAKVARRRGRPRGAAPRRAAAKRARKPPQRLSAEAGAAPTERDPLSTDAADASAGAGEEAVPPAKVGKEHGHPAHRQKSSKSDLATAPGPSDTLEVAMADSAAAAEDVRKHEKLPSFVARAHFQSVPSPARSGSNGTSVASPSSTSSSSSSITTNGSNRTESRGSDATTGSWFMDRLRRFSGRGLGPL